MTEAAASVVSFPHSGRVCGSRNPSSGRPCCIIARYFVTSVSQTIALPLPTVRIAAAGPASVSHGIDRSRPTTRSFGLNRATTPEKGALMISARAPPRGAGVSNRTMRPACLPAVRSASMPSDSAQAAVGSSTTARPPSSIQPRTNCTCVASIAAPARAGTSNQTQVSMAERLSCRAWMTVAVPTSCSSAFSHCASRFQADRLAATFGCVSSTRQTSPRAPGRSPRGAASRSCGVANRNRWASTDAASITSTATTVTASSTPNRRRCEKRGSRFTSCTVRTGW